MWFIWVYGCLWVALRPSFMGSPTSANGVHSVGRAEAGVAFMPPSGIRCEPLAERGLTIRLVVRRSADVPTVRLQGLQATRLVFLRVERRDVLCGLRHVLATGSYSAGDRREACTLCLLVSGDGCRTFHFLAQIQAVAVATCGRGDAVRAKQHLCAAVLTTLTRFTQCAGYTVNTGTPFYFCHVR